MPLPSLPYECFSNIFSFLDNESLYKCLFVSRYYCKLSIPIMWKDPFTTQNNNNNISFSLINTLLSCLNEDEVSSLIPCAIYLINFNDQSPLFEYGNFIRKIDHYYCMGHVYNWLYLSNERLLSPYLHHVPENQDCRVRKLIDVIYHMIMRKGSNLREFFIYSDSCRYIDLPKFSTFTIYKPGITNLSSLSIFYNTSNDIRHQNIIEFLSMVSEFCNCIINCEVRIQSFVTNYTHFTDKILNIVKLQPLRKILLSGDYVNIKKILYTLNEFRTETLKELLFTDINFQNVDLSFIKKFKFLERLEFVECNGFTFREKLHLRELKLCYYYKSCNNTNIKLHTVSMINLFGSEILHKLSLNIVTPEIIKAVKETSPNISFLCIELFSRHFYIYNLAISLIGELSSLKILNLKLNGDNVIVEMILIRLLCKHLIFVEELFLDFFISLDSFEYFTSNCKVKLKRLDILVDNCNVFDRLRERYLVHVNNFQKVHNSLKIFGIKGYYKRKFNWTKKEIEIINLLKNQGTDIILSNNDYTNYTSALSSS